MERVLCVVVFVGCFSAARADEKEDPNVTAMKARLEAQAKELESLKKQVEKLEKERVDLVVAKETAVREQLRAENERNFQKALADDYAKKVVELTAKLKELKGPNPGAPKDTVRGEVTKTGATGQWLELNIGIDAGLEVGMVLDVIRVEGKNEARYLGTVTIQGTSLRPKEAAGEFKPARKVPLAQLKADELPRKGDTVTKIIDK